MAPEGAIFKISGIWDESFIFAFAQSIEKYLSKQKMKGSPKEPYLRKPRALIVSR